METGRVDRTAALPSLSTIHYPLTTRSRTTLALCALLHSFTHAYGTMLVPLYLLMVADLHLAGVKQVSLIVTLYGLTYALGSYTAGVLADRFNRKALLGVGLIGNALAITVMGLTRRYEMLLALGIAAGALGALFHPAANALATAHFPRSPGMAIGILGMGSGLGFFVGPQYAGWRAQTAQWSFADIANWQKPCIELGLFGIIFGILFLFIAREARTHSRRIAIRRLSEHPKLGSALRRRMTAIASILSMRDFAGIATLSLLSIYLQKAHGYDVRRAGFTIGAMMLLSIIVNPFAVAYSARKRRLPALVIVLIAGGIVLSVVPWLAAVWVLPLMCVFQTFSLSSYAISDAATLERVSAEVRGRVVGLQLTLAGTFASTAPFVIGYWTDLLRDRASDPRAYIAIFSTVAAMMILASFATSIIARLGSLKGPEIEPISETEPRTVEVVG